MKKFLIHDNIITPLVHFSLLIPSKKGLSKNQKIGEDGIRTHGTYNTYIRLAI